MTGLPGGALTAPAGVAGGALGATAASAAARNARGRAPMPPPPPQQPFRPAPAFALTDVASVTTDDTGFTAQLAATQAAVGATRGWDDSHLCGSLLALTRVGVGGMAAPPLRLQQQSPFVAAGAGAGAGAGVALPPAAAPGAGECDFSRYVPGASAARALVGLHLAPSRVSWLPPHAPHTAAAAAGAARRDAPATAPGPVLAVDLSPGGSAHRYAVCGPGNPLLRKRAREAELGLEEDRVKARARR